MQSLAGRGEVGDAGGGVGVLGPSGRASSPCSITSDSAGTRNESRSGELVAGVAAADGVGLEALGEHQDPERGLASLGEQPQHRRGDPLGQLLVLGLRCAEQAGELLEDDQDQRVWTRRGDRVARGRHGVEAAVHLSATSRSSIVGVRDAGPWCR